MPLCGIAHMPARMQSAAVCALMPEIEASARRDFLTCARAYIGPAVRALVVAPAGPGVLPGSPEAIAFVVVDESGLAARFLLRLMRAMMLFLHADQATSRPLIRASSAWAERGFSAVK